MSLSFSTALRNARANSIINAMDTGDNHATMQFYTGAKPAISGSEITTQTKLGTVTFSKPCATALNGQVTFLPIADDVVADATGLLGWGRVLNGAGEFVMDLDCGVDGTSAVVIFNNLNVFAGGIISVSSGTLTEANL